VVQQSSFFGEFTKLVFQERRALAALASWKSDALL
jgi:hypothetical protein